MPLAELLTAAGLLEACITGLIGNRADAATKWLGSAGFNRLTGEASSEAPIILTAMHKCFALSVAAMGRACDSVGGDPASHFARRALHDFARSKELRAFDPQRHQLSSNLLEEQVRSIFGQQDRTPREAATDRAIAIVEAGMGTALTEPLREIFFTGHGRYRGWAEQFELFFAAEVSTNQKLANILSLDRQNELMALAQEQGEAIDELREELEKGFSGVHDHIDASQAVLLRAIEKQNAAQFLDDLARGTAEPELLERFQRIVAEQSASSTATIEQVAEAAVIQTEFARSSDAAQQAAAQLFDQGKPLEAAAQIDAAIRTRREDDDAAIRTRQEADDASCANEYRRLAIATLPASIEAAVGYYTRATDLDPTDFWTWIELARLHRAAGSLPQARRAADAARQHAAEDRETMVANGELGDIAIAEGDLPTARHHFTAAMQAAQDRAYSDPGDAEWQHDLSVSHDKLGTVAVAKGDLAGAASAYRASLTIREALAARDPGNATWQRDLSVSHDQLGNVAAAQGDLAGAASAYRASLTIREALAARDPGNAEWQHDLSVSHNKLGDVAVAQGDLAGAATAYRASQDIFDVLAARDPGNAKWQRDLSVNHNKLGDVASAQGDLAGAAMAYRASLAIREALSARDRGNAAWQRDLSVSHNKLGDVAVAQGDLAGAAAAYRASQTIGEALAARGPDNAEWQRDLFICHDRLGRLAEAGGDREGAIAEFTAAESILVALIARVGEHPQFVRDLAGVRREIDRLRDR